MRVVLLLVLLSFHFSSSGQKCLVDASNHGESTLQFEEWMSSRRMLRLQKRIRNTEYVLPVVFHIIHQGEEIGTGSNLSDDRIFNQIDILNHDYGRTNSDTSATPDVFLPDVANTGISFALARRDPEGLPTNGIVRKVGVRSSYSRSDFEALILESYWDPEKYINIVVTELSGNSIGWASFPFSGLDGIEDVAVDPQADAAIIDHRFIGENDDTGANFQSFGRTLTHELGHYLGLRHVWGDILNCSGSDFCEDTPVQSVTYLGQCPTDSESSCGTDDMYSNYMNYTNDACMNLFTNCQGSRMRIVLENSPRRSSLLTSKALTEPVIVANDLGIRRIIESNYTTCGPIVSPVIEVRNYGTNVINTFEVQVLVNGEIRQTQQLNEALDPLSTLLVNFNPVDLSNVVDGSITYQVTDVNNQIDENSENNSMQEVIPDFGIELIPFSVDFETESLPSYIEFGLSGGWEETQAPNTILSNNAATIDFASQEFGALNYLVTPPIDINGFSSMEVSFDYAYSWDGDPWSKDGLVISISNDCGQSYSFENPIFSRFSPNLETVLSGDLPVGPQDWESQTITVTSPTENDIIRIAFIGVNGGNGKLYLDNLVVNPGNVVPLDVGIRSISNLPVVTCDESVAPLLQIGNFGFETLNRYSINYILDNQTTIISHANTELMAGEQTNVQFTIDNLNEGVNEVAFVVDQPNGLMDQNIENNIEMFKIARSNASEGLPTFNDFQTDNNWIKLNPSGDDRFESYQDGTDNQLLIRGFSSEQLTENWLISPLLSTAELASNLSMSFSFAHKGRPGFADNLKVVISKGCDGLFDEIIFDKSSPELSNTFSDVEFIAEENDWQEEVIDLSSFVDEDELRVAFVYTTRNGNNLFLDDIYFYNTNDPTLNPTEDLISIFPNPVTNENFRLVLNLRQQIPITITLVDMSGRVVSSSRFEYGLNQVVDYEVPGLEGVYLLRVQGPGTNISRTVVLK